MNQRDYVEEEIIKKADEVMKMDSDAKKIVLGFTTTATGTGAVPIPFADLPLLIGQQVLMMSAIAQVFGINVKKDGLKVLVMQVLGTGGASVLGKTVVANLLKLVSGGGTLAGGAISAATAGAITCALGMAFIEICHEVKIGKLAEKDMFSKKTAKELQKRFKESLKNK